VEYINYLTEPMTAIYAIGALTFAAFGFALGVMWSARRMAAIMERVTDEALKRERGYAP
jgi:hypothetical protein